MNTQTERITYLEAVTFMISPISTLKYLIIKYVIYDIRSISKWWQLWAANEKNWAGSQKGLFAAKVKLVFAVFDIAGVSQVQTVTLVFAEAVFS